jgi:uncharacterized membrane protein YedE/YeeE
MAVAGALKFVAILFGAGAIIGVAAFRAELLVLFPFVGATGVATPAIFAVLVIAVGLLFWGIADIIALLAEHMDEHEELKAAILNAARRPAPAANSVKAAGVGDVPGFQRYQRPMPRVLKWTANVTNGPALLANPVCEIQQGAPVTAIGELKEFAFVETPGGNGWLPKDSLADRLAGLATSPPARAG